MGVAGKATNVWFLAPAKPRTGLLQRSCRVGLELQVQEKQEQLQDEEKQTTVGQNNDLRYEWYDLENVLRRCDLGCCRRVNLLLLLLTAFLTDHLVLL